MANNVTNTVESKFDGSLLGMIGVSLLMGLISSVTLGIGLPWALCLYKRWIYSHTIVDGRRLKFDGTGGQLIGNWIKWYLLTLVTLSIYGWWVPIKLQQWETKHIHFE